MQTPKHYRAKEILNILKTHGPLTRRGISRIVNPPMKERKLQMAIARLNNKGLIVVRTEKLFGRRCFIYQLAQDKNGRADTSQLIECSPDALLQPFFRYREIIHNDSCALVTDQLSQIYPEGKIVRDFEFTRNPQAQQVLLSNERSRELKPDILLSLTNELNNSPTHIVFEIEKTRKDNKRLINKLNKYAKWSYVDGVIYICSEERIIEALQHCYTNKVLAKALRIKHYGEFFLMFMTDKDINNLANAKLFNFNKKSVSITKWISFLNEIPNAKRRNEKSAIGAV